MEIGAKSSAAALLSRLFPFVLRNPWRRGRVNTTGARVVNSNFYEFLIDVRGRCARMVDRSIDGEPIEAGLVPGSLLQLVYDARGKLSGRLLIGNPRGAKG